MIFVIMGPHSYTLSEKMVLNRIILKDFFWVKKIRVRENKVKIVKERNELHNTENCVSCFYHFLVSLYFPIAFWNLFHFYHFRMFSFINFPQNTSQLWIKSNRCRLRSEELNDIRFFFSSFFHAHLSLSIEKWFKWND